LEYCARKSLIERENWWIDLLETLDPHRGYNMRKADGMDISDETRAKLSRAHKGRIGGGMTGKQHTEETKKMLADISRGKTHTAGTRSKMSASHKRKHGDKQRTHCTCGRELVGGNLYVDPGGRKYCRWCRSQRYIRYRAKR
jgi:group I intron endonuclease